MVARAEGHQVEVIDDPVLAPDAVRSHRADVCVMDLHYPGANGVEAVAAVRRSHPLVRILVLSGRLDDETVAAVRAVGATAWTVKCGSLDDVMRLVVGAPASEQFVVEDHWSTDATARFLTQRERRVLEALTEGSTTAELAQRFGVSPATVSTHVQSILSKLGVHSRLEAVAFAVSHALVEPSRERLSA